MLGMLDVWQHSKYALGCKVSLSQSLVFQVFSWFKMRKRLLSAPCNLGLNVNIQGLLVKVEKVDLLLWLCSNSVTWKEILAKHAEFLKNAECIIWKGRLISKVRMYDQQYCVVWFFLSGYYRQVSKKTEMWHN